MMKGMSPGCFCRLSAAVLLLLAATTSTRAQTEFHLQIGKIKNPFSREDVTSTILTVQQVSFWRLGESFFFLDYISDRKWDGFNDRDFYAEWYPTLSIGKLTKADVGFGPIRDFAIIAGVNMGADAKVLKYLPGLRASWDIPGFLFLNTDLTAYIDRNAGVEDGGAPKTGNSFTFDVNWGFPFETGSQSFGIFGHVEYIDGRSDELGNQLEGSILAQPQFTWDLGRALANEPNQIIVGIEYQYWKNKLGTETDENTIQFLLVWRL